MQLEKHLQELAEEDKPPRYATLAGMSDMSRFELDKFSRVWSNLSIERQRTIISRLVEMAEENVDLDFDPIFQLCINNSDAAVREKAILGLWECEDRTIIGPLIDRLTKDTSPEVRSAAAVALGRFATLANEAKLPPVDGQRIKDALIGVLRNPQDPADVRRRALESVAPFNTLVVQELIRKSYDSNDLRIRASALFAMGKTGEMQWMRYLLRELRGQSPILRFEAANACGELGEESCVPYLIPLLEDDDLQVQLAAIRALGEIGGAMATRALRRCSHSEEQAIRDASTEALENLEGERSPLSFRFRA